MTLTFCSKDFQGSLWLWVCPSQRKDICLLSSTNASTANAGSTPCIIVSFVTFISFFVGKKGSVPEGGLGRHEGGIIGLISDKFYHNIMHHNYTHHNIICCSTRALDTTSRATDRTDFINWPGRDWLTSQTFDRSDPQQSQPNTAQNL